MRLGLPAAFGPHRSLSCLHFANRETVRNVVNHEVDLRTGARLYKMPGVRSFSGLGRGAFMLRAAMFLRAPRKIAARCRHDHEAPSRRRKLLLFSPRRQHRLWQSAWLWKLRETGWRGTTHASARTSNSTVRDRLDVAIGFRRLKTRMDWSIADGPRYRGPRAPGFPSRKCSQSGHLDRASPRLPDGSTRLSFLNGDVMIPALPCWRPVADVADAAFWLVFRFEGLHRVAARGIQSLAWRRLRHSPAALEPSDALLRDWHRQERAEWWSRAAYAAAEEYDNPGLCYWEFRRGRVIPRGIRWLLDRTLASSSHMSGWAVNDDIRWLIDITGVGRAVLRLAVCLNNARSRLSRFRLDARVMSADIFHTFDPGDDSWSTSVSG